MSTFKDSIQVQQAEKDGRRRQKMELVESRKKKRKAAIAVQRGSFKTASVALQALMDEDPAFAAYIKERVVQDEWWPYKRWLVCEDIGTHPVTTQYKFHDATKDVPTTWCLLVQLSDKGRVIVVCRRWSWGARIDELLPYEVFEFFRPFLEMLQDRNRVFRFLLEEFGLPGQSEHEK